MIRPFHVEVVQKRQSPASKDVLKGLVHSFLSNFKTLTPGVTLKETELASGGEDLNEHVLAITFCDVEHESDVQMPVAELVYHVFKLDAFGAETDTMADGDGADQVSVADVWPLPARDFHGLWESLVFDTRLKQDTVQLVETAFELAQRSVNPHIVGWNRVVLLHGPPGTGKTSLCRALAQKLSVRLGERFARARLVEINAHGLFSKWFSESGKQVARLFERVHELAEDPRLLVCVLIDEVESLAHARRAALAGLEPSDSIRAVNALLTELDRLQRCANALVLTTSNVTSAIDVAFADRADIKRRVGPPSARAAYHILRGCCAELTRCGLVMTAGTHLFDLSALEGSQFVESDASAASLRLWEVARAAAVARLSGRALRRLPFLALALRTQRAVPSLLRYVDMLRSALHAHIADEESYRELGEVEANA